MRALEDSALLSHVKAFPIWSSSPASPICEGCWSAASARRSVLPRPCSGELQSALFLRSTALAQFLQPPRPELEI
jgi:hypothetical protein